MIRRRVGSVSMRLGLALALMLLPACGGEDPTVPGVPPTAATPGGMTLASHPLREGTFPVEFTCDGADTSPPMEWSGVPDQAAELVLSLVDPEAPGGPFVHWVVYGIEPADGSVEAGEVPADGVEGTNDFDRTGYGGPCPPAGETHDYVLALLASSTTLELEPGASLFDVTQAMGAPLAAAQLTASYGR